MDTNEAPECACVNWPRSDELIGITAHHPACEHFKLPELWAYEVACGEIDTVFAKSEDDAKAVSKECGCHCEHDDSDGELIVRKMTIEKMSKQMFRDDDERSKRSVLTEFRLNQRRGLCCSTIW